MCMYFIRVDGLFISSAITVVQFGISCKPHFAITNVCCNASYVQHAYRRQIGMKRKPRTPRAPPPGATRNAKIAGSPRVKNITKNRAPSWATNMNRNNRNAGMIASSEDVDQAKLEAFEKNHAKNRSNSGMKFSRRGSMWKNANKGWNTTALKDIDPSIEQNSKILKSKPKWGSYSTRGVCNYVSPRGPPGSLGKPHLKCISRCLKISKVNVMQGLLQLRLTCSLQSIRNLFMPIPSSSIRRCFAILCNHIIGPTCF